MALTENVTLNCLSTDSEIMYWYKGNMDNEITPMDGVKNAIQLLVSFLNLIFKDIMRFK